MKLLFAVVESKKKLHLDFETYDYHIFNGDIDGNIVEGTKIIKNIDKDSNKSCDTYITAKKLKNK